MTQPQESSNLDLGDGLERALAGDGEAPKSASASEAKSSKSGAQPANRRSLPSVVEEAIGRDVRVMLTKSGYEIDGFYKLGPVRLEPAADGAHLVAIDRKEVSTSIKTFDDLVRLNYECWKKSRDKGAAFINPGREWVEEFGRLNLVKRQVIFVPGDD